MPFWRALTIANQFITIRIATCNMCRRWCNNWPVSTSYMLRCSSMLTSIVETLALAKVCLRTLTYHSLPTQSIPLHGLAYQQHQVELSAAAVLNWTLTSSSFSSFRRCCKIDGYLSSFSPIEASHAASSLPFLPDIRHCTRTIHNTYQHSPYVNMYDVSCVGGSSYEAM